MESRLMITAASAYYGPAVLSLIGSANVNWPDHPRFIVYDLGLPCEILEALRAANLEVRRVPAFCPHWRRHFTWKVWCCQDVPSENYLWLNAGICVLRPFPEAFVCMEQLGYYCVPNGFHIGHSACRALRARFPEYAFDEILSINAGLHGFNKRKAGMLIAEAFQLCQAEELMAADTPWGRHDQDLLSVLLYRHFSPVTFCDRQIYAEHLRPDNVVGQRVWHHRRHMQPEDIEYYRQSVLRPGAPRIPRPPAMERVSWARKIRVAVAKWRGRYPDHSRIIYDGVRD